MEILEKVAYMKGLAEGLGLDTKTKEGKLLTVMIDILDDIALELRDIRDDQGELEEALGYYEEAWDCGKLDEDKETVERLRKMVEGRE